MYTKFNVIVNKDEYYDVPATHAKYIMESLARIFVLFKIALATRQSFLAFEVQVHQRW